MGKISAVRETHTMVGGFVMADPQINTGTVVVCINDANAKGIKKKRYYHVIRQYVLGGFSYLELEGIPGRFSTRRFKVTMK